MNVGIICARKSSDALISQAVESVFGQTTVVRYLIPPQHWVSWLWHRIRERGFFTLIGLLALSAYLRGERLIDRLKGRNLWSVVDRPTPKWSDLKMPPFNFLSERALIKKLSDCDVIISLDAIRLSHRFYRKTKARFFQVVWGEVPDAMGDSGAFWQYAIHHPKYVSVSVIERIDEKGSVTTHARLHVPVGDQETLRTIKIKQADTLAEELPRLIKEVAKVNPKTAEKKQRMCSFYYPPTLATYLTFLKKGKLSKLPKYALRKKACAIYIPL